MITAANTNKIRQVSGADVPEQGVDGHLLPRDALLQHVIGERGEAEEGLQDGVHVAGVAQVGEATTQRRGAEHERTCGDQQLRFPVSLICSPLQRRLGLSQRGGPLLVPATVVQGGAHLLEGGGVVGQHEAPLGCRGLSCAGRSEIRGGVAV